MDVSSWFKGFEKGIAQLSPKEREHFFYECGKNCVKNGVFPIFRTLYEESNGDIDIFFNKTNELQGVKSETIEKGHIYNLYFQECTCGLRNEGYISTPLLCECSRQSVLYTMSHLWEQHKFEIILCHSILQGKHNCKIRIKIIK